MRGQQDIEYDMNFRSAFPHRYRINMQNAHNNIPDKNPTILSLKLLLFIFLKNEDQ